MTASLHLGPYQGRDADLADVVGGVLCNPMTQAHASLIALATAMDFLARSRRLRRRARLGTVRLADVGGDRAGPLAVLARACADSPIAEPATLDLARRVAALDDALAGPDWPEAVGRRSRAELRRGPRPLRGLPRTARGRRSAGRRGRSVGARGPAARPRPGWPHCA